MTMPSVPPGGVPPLPQPPPAWGVRTTQTYSRMPWIVLAVSLSAVIALVVGLLVWRGPSGGGNLGPGDPSNAAGGVVDRSVGLVREKDPVCDEWIRFSAELAEKEEAWSAADQGTPATVWTEPQRETFADLSRAMETAADRFESILPSARNVVLQELIAQVIVHLRIFVDKVPNYVAADRAIAGVAGNFGTATTFICTAVPLLPLSGADNAASSEVVDPSALTPFMKTADPICEEFIAVLDRQDAALAGWYATDWTIPSTSWTANQRNLSEAVAEVLERDLLRFSEFAEKAKDRIVGDLLTTQNAYLQVFVDALPSYVPDDNQFWTVGSSLGGGIKAACEAQL